MRIIQNKLLSTSWLLFFMMAMIYISLIPLFIPGIVNVSWDILLGLGLLPFILNIDTGKRSIKYLPLCILFILLTFFIKVPTFYFFVITFCLLLSIETLKGTTNHPFSFLLIIISPAFKYIISIVGFPIRIKLSEAAAALFNLVNMKTETMGNILIVNGNEFSVDEACAGLNMLTASLIIALVIIAHFERQQSKRINFINTIVIMLVTVLLNIICNYIRIIVLVLLKISPENAMHEVIGILCMIIYVVIPIIFFIRKNFRLIKPFTFHSEIHDLKRWAILNFVMMALVIYLGTQIKSGNDTHLDMSCNITGFKKEHLKSGVIKFENQASLIYVKPVRSFYGAEHNPMICWEGSGYEFKRIKKTRIENIEIYTGELCRKSEKLFSAWWFDNGNHKTIDHFDWRWRVINGEPTFSLINVNATTEKELKSEIIKLLNKNIFIQN